jgi:2-polyprenyl-6-methoxyphenol hydroxylase-like FAD-dependent oxidoreductase
MQQQPSVLVSGASVAGPIAAYWLRRFGFRPTVVERTSELRVGGGGHAVDLFDSALDVMAWMGVRDKVEDARTMTAAVSLVRRGGRTVGASLERLWEGVGERHVEIMRGDLAQILYEAGADDLEYIFGDSISALNDIGPRVEVTFEHTPPRTFDLVVGADGLHSTTRRLTFGDERQFRNFLGGYLAVFTAPNYLRLDRRMVSFGDVDRTIGMYPVRDGRARVLFLLRSRNEVPFDHHDSAAQRQLLIDRFGDLDWEVPRLLAELEQADDLYLDSISQIVMDTWSRGRVTLVGDAGYSPGAAVGGGTSLAVLGGYVLATELAEAKGQPGAGFAAYERALARAVQASRKIGPDVMKIIIPRSQTQIWLTAQAMRILPRLPVPIRRSLTAYGGGPSAMLKSVTLRDPTQVATSAS